MIKVGIIGAHTPHAGELLRILHLHPDVDVTTLYSPTLAGRSLSSCHHGFLGETPVNFTDKISPSELDIVYIADDSKIGKEIIDRSDEWPSLRIVDLSPRRFEFWESNGLEYGLSEINRKTLVRGARMAIVPSPVAALSLAALYPLASHLLLSSDIEIEVAVPEEIAKKIDTDSVSKEIASMLIKTQTSFNGKVKIIVNPANLTRSMRIKISLKCPLDISEIYNVFESVYDDHSFTYHSYSEISTNEVEGTQKCVVTYKKPTSTDLELISIGDCYLRGGAGDAVHLLNLFFALDEKIGLTLKPSCYGGDSSAAGQASWFA